MWTALPEYLSNIIESVQKKAQQIMLSYHSYQEALNATVLHASLLVEFLHVLISLLKQGTLFQSQLFTKQWNN